MTLIQPLLIVLLAVAAVLFWGALRSTLLARLIGTTLLGIGILFVVHPEFTSRLAKLFGVGRGADLLLYFLAVATFYGFVLMYIKLRSLEHQLTKIVRLLSIHNAVEPTTNATRT